MERDFPNDFPFAGRRDRGNRDAAAAAAEAGVTVLTEADIVDLPLDTPVLVEAALHGSAEPLVAPLGSAEASPAIEQTAAPEAPVVLESTAPTKAAAAGGRERRRSPRQALRAKAMFRNDEDATGLAAVQLVDLSLTGVRFVAKRPLVAGDRGDLKMEIGPIKWASRVRVMTCKLREGTGYEIGCEFIQKELTRRPVNIKNPLVWAPVRRASSDGEKKAA